MNAIEPTALDKAAELIGNARLLAVSSGAGMSKESGIPTFRDALEGLWARYDPEELATPDAFRRNPDLVWAWYRARGRRIAEAQPNPGHFALAALEAALPRVVVLTQNVDGLHTRAGSRDVVELHGRIDRYKCFGSCQGDPTMVEINQDASDDHAPICPFCDRERVRPDVVWFGEMLPARAIERAYDVARTCDVMLVVGTSGVVQPAASLPGIAKAAGALVIEVNPEPSQITRSAAVFLRGPSGAALPALAELVRARLSV